MKTGLKTLIWFSLQAVLLGQAPASFSGQGFSVKDAHKAYFLAEHVERNYGRAVVSDGQKIQSDIVYDGLAAYVDELRGFRSRMSTKPGVLQAFDQLLLSFDKKQAVPTVQRQAGQLQKRLLADFAIPQQPASKPDLVLGEKFYQRTCQQCHGDDGKANTATAKTMVPRPQSLVELGKLDELTPLQIYNMITFGVTWAAMPSLVVLTEEQRWSVAYYIYKFHPRLKPVAESDSPAMDWREAAPKTDQQILAILESKKIDKAQQLQELARTRLLHP